MLCCTRRRKQQAPKSTTSSGSSSHDIDLAENEGSDLQESLWQDAYRSKIHSSPESKYLQGLAAGKEITSAQTCLESVTRQYQAHGFARKATEIKRILDSVLPLTAAISALTQSEQIASLTWGAVLFVFQSTLKFVNVFDTIKSMVGDLTRLLPRFNTYVHLFPTPRLHNALREIYETYVQFCITTASFLDANTLYLCLKLQWSGIDQVFKSAQQEIQSLAQEFESEAVLASAQKDKLRHQEILSRLPGNMEKAVTTGGLVARNPLFVGRESVLRQLKSHLLPDELDSTHASRPRRNCVIHGVGGLGKSQIALEYTYRFRHCYDYIFWLQAESHAVLTESFLNLVRKLGIDSANLTPAKQIDLGGDWLESTASNWILVFDNAESAEIILPFWPAGVHGSILVTTQHSDLALMTTATIDLSTLDPGEGSELIRMILRRGDSEKEAAEKLSIELGGHPLAIAHFAGYVAKSQCALDDILGFLQKSKRSNLIWSSENLVAASNYTRTLETIWDLAVTRLSSDAKSLLNIIAFMNPDCMQQELFLDDEAQDQELGQRGWTTIRFNEAVGMLRERHLVDRKQRGKTSYLTTHRSLQSVTLRKLDARPAERQVAFDAAQAITRRAFPHQSIVKRGDTSTWPASRKYLPHVMSLHTAFVGSDPPIPDKLDLAVLLGDAGRFLFEWFWNSEAVPLLQTARGICERHRTTEPHIVEATLPAILCHLGLYEQCDGILGRDRARRDLAEAVAMQEQYLDRLPAQDVSVADMVNLGRFYNDLGVSYLEDDQVPPAEPLFLKALETYETVGGKSFQAVRYGHTFSHQALAHLANGDVAEAQSRAQSGCDIIQEVLGCDSHGYLFYTFSRAVILFNAGKVDDALELHNSVLESLQRILGYSHHHTLASLYHVAVCEQARGNLETAEYEYTRGSSLFTADQCFRRHLRELLKHDALTYQWREEDMARAAYRLSLVLQEQNRTQEAARYHEHARTLRLKWVDSIPEHVGRDLPAIEKEMSRYDYGVWIWHGRTSGIWNPGRRKDVGAVL